MNRRHFIHSLLPSLPLLAGCNAQFWVNPPTEEYGTLTMSEQRYSVKYPSGWEVNTDKPEHVKIAPQESGVPYMGINKNDLSAPKRTLEEIIPVFKQRVSNQLGYKIVGERSTSLPSGESAMVFDAQFSDPEISDSDLHVTYCLVVANESLYLVTYFASERDYKSSKKEINTVVTSLTIK